MCQLYLQLTDKEAVGFVTFIQQQKGLERTWSQERLEPINKSKRFQRSLTFGRMEEGPSAEFLVSRSESSIDRVSLQQTQTCACPCYVPTCDPRPSE